MTTGDSSHNEVDSVLIKRKILEVDIKSSQLSIEIHKMEIQSSRLQLSLMNAENEEYTQSDSSTQQWQDELERLNNGIAGLRLRVRTFDVRRARLVQLLSNLGHQDLPRVPDNLDLKTLPTPYV